MDTEVTLQRLGLPKHSGRIYDTIESSGPSTPSALQRATQLHRPALYRTLRALTERGFIAPEKKGARFVYRANTRTLIHDHFVRTATQIDTARTTTVVHDSIRQYRGAAGITAVFEDVVVHCKRGETFFRYTSERDLDEVNSYLPADYRTRRDNKNLERLVISNAESGSRKRKRLERFIKYLGDAREPFQHNAIHLIYGSRIALIDLNTQECYVIENRTLAEFQTTLFRSLYRRL